MIETPPEALFSQPPRRKGQPAGRVRYGAVHRRLRAWWKPRVEAGGVLCCAVICLYPDRAIWPGTPWVLGHSTEGSVWTGPEHRRCGESDGARRSGRTPAPRPWIATRAW
jgi:hypothetical protein